MTTAITYMVFVEIVGTLKPWKPRSVQVTIGPEYGSTFEDIRKVIAIPLGLKATNIQIKSLMEMPK
jgi:hypothetical protein